MTRTVAVISGSALAFTLMADLVLADVQSLRGENPLDALSELFERKYLERSESVFERSWKTAPPMIPHSYKAFKINRELNACAYCHVRDHEWMKAPRAGKSHFTNSAEAGSPTLDTRRYFCMQCHAPQHSTAPIVGNTFGSGVH